MDSEVEGEMSLSLWEGVKRIRKVDGQRNVPFVVG